MHQNETNPRQGASEAYPSAPLSTYPQVKPLRPTDEPQPAKSSMFDGCLGMFMFAVLSGFAFGFLGALGGALLVNANPQHRGPSDVLGGAFLGFLVLGFIGFWIGLLYRGVVGWAKTIRQVRSAWQQGQQSAQTQYAPVSHLPGYDPGTYGREHLPPAQQTRNLDVPPDSNA